MNRELRVSTPVLSEANGLHLCPPTESRAPPTKYIKGDSEMGIRRGIGFRVWFFLSERKSQLAVINISSDDEECKRPDSRLLP